jgi:hypothetical protein
VNISPVLLCKICDDSLSCSGIREPRLARFLCVWQFEESPEELAGTNLQTTATPLGTVIREPHEAEFDLLRNIKQFTRVIRAAVVPSNFHPIDTAERHFDNPGLELSYDEVMSRDNPHFVEIPANPQAVLLL